MQALREHITAQIGLVSGDNDRFFRRWYEISVANIEFTAMPSQNPCIKKWYPLQKGGEFRRWYGNLDYVINWQNDGFEIKNNYLGTRVRSHNYNGTQQFKEGLTWSSISSYKFTARYTPYGFTFDAAGPLCEVNDKSEINYILGLFNSNVVCNMFGLINPTINFPPGYLEVLPFEKQKCDIVNTLVQQNIDLCKTDWDSFETSWDFKKHPLIRNVSSIEDAYCEWEKECNLRFNQLKANEEELNRIFIDIYGLQKELTPEVENKDISVRKADLTRDIKSFISYAIGCMFGRYSLDTDGIAFAGGNWDSSKYKTFIPDEDAIIPITDQDYFADDIVERFTEFVKVVYGEDTLEKNLRFIAKALGNGDEAPQHVLRNYFMKDFFADHCKVYQKRPIYWLFDSGKKNSFKALIYTHRYRSDTIARLRTLYLHEIQNKYIAEHEKLDKAIATTTGKAQTRAKKELNVVTAKEEELNAYEKKIHHFADSKIAIDLDDGVKHNYALFADVLAKIK